MGTGARLLRRDRSAAPSGGSGRGVLVGTGARCRGMRRDRARLLRENRGRNRVGRAGLSPAGVAGARGSRGRNGAGERRGRGSVPRRRRSGPPGAGARCPGLPRGAALAAVGGSGARCRGSWGSRGSARRSGAQGGRAPAAVLRELLTVLQIFLGFLFLESRGPPGPPRRSGSGFFAAKR